MSSLTGPSIRVIDVNGGGTPLPLTLINAYSALTVPAYRRAVQFLAENLASFPRSVRRDGAKTDEAHPLNRLLKLQPNRLQNATQFWRTLFFHAVHANNGYARIERDTGAANRPATFRPVALHNLPPEDVLPFRWDPGDGTGPVQFYFHKPTKTAIPGIDVIHIGGLSHDGMAGLDPVALHESTFQRAATITRYETEYLRKGTVIRGSVEIPGMLTEDQRTTIQAALRRYRGGDSDDDIMILSDGAKLTNTTTSPQQSQLAEQSAATTKQIAQITGVPPVFLFDMADARYNNSVEQAGQDVVRYTFRPWIQAAQDELTLKLLTEAEIADGLSIRLNPDALLRGDTKTQSDVVTAQVNAGLRTKNEGRAVLELPPDPDPASDKLQTLGASTPATPPAGRSTASAYAAIKPVIDAACARVDVKTDKAFATHGSKKAGPELTVWANVFAEEQGRYAAEALTPVSAALEALGAAPLDVPKIAERYAAAVRRRAATGEATPLADIAHPAGDMSSHAE